MLEVEEEMEEVVDVVEVVVVVEVTVPGNGFVLRGGDGLGRRMRSVVQVENTEEVVGWVVGK